jgi:hypothetical protein
MDPTVELCAALSAIPGARAGHSRMGSGRNRAWFFAGLEFAHLHSSCLVDLRLPRRLQATLRSDPRAHFRASRSEWLELEFHSRKDVADIAAFAREAAAAAQARQR